MSFTIFHKLMNRYWDPNWNKLRSHVPLATLQGEKWQNLIPLLEQISAQNAVFIMIWNLMTNRIIYTVDKRKVYGYDASLYLAENGMNFSMGNMHPHFIQSSLMMQQQAIEFMNQQANLEEAKVVANMEGVYKRSTGQYYHFLQQSLCMEFDNEGNPLLFLSYVHDVSYMKKYRTANLVITTPNELKWWNFNYDTNCLEPLPPLSKQQKKILCLSAEGKCSKEIARELFISSHTVDTHRRNLLEKTNCVDTTGMITYAKLVGLL